MDALLRDRSLLYVTGKGGVGKTTVAAAIALAAARSGRRTIVCEVADQDRMSRAFGRPEARLEQEVELADGLWAITIDPQAALEEWLARQLGGGAAARLLGGSNTFQYFVAAAPGARELITMGKVFELTRAERWNESNRAYDLVVVDAPASGHGLAMLTTPRTFAEIARVGTVRRQADKVYSLLTDPARAGYVAVALPEEMPVTETLELEARLRATLGMPLDRIVVNALWPDRFTRADITRLRGLLRDADATPAARVAAAPPAAAPAPPAAAPAPPAAAPAPPAAAPAPPAAAPAPPAAAPAPPAAAPPAADDRLGAVRAALAAHERAKAQRAQVRRLEAASAAALIRLPFVFESDLELEHYERLADALDGAAP